MVAIVVYFESIHHASAHAAQSAACADATAAAATAAASASAAANEAAAPSMDELRLRYQQGLDLLLNAADLEQPCMAIFNEYESITAEQLEAALGPSLLKKFKQLELYEVPCFACVTNPAAVDAEDADDAAADADTVADANAMDSEDAEGAADASDAEGIGEPCAACDKGACVALVSATAKVFEFVQTVGFEREFEILQEANVKTFTM